VDFLTIINPKQGVEVFGYWIPRARLGRHLRLDKIAGEVDKALKAGDSIAAAQAIDAYLSLCGLPQSILSGFDQILGYSYLIRLNALQGAFAFQRAVGPEGKVPAYHYSGRYIAWWVHKLSSHYGWSRDNIFELWPEEAAAYLQEILVQEAEDFERWRSLSELSYRYDKTTQKSRFIPTPKPNWMVAGDQKKTIRVRRDMLPIGNIVELDKLYPQKKD
jgi:hypothetical protein